MRRKLIFLIAFSLAAPLRATEFPSPAELTRLRAYIKTSWTTLTRSVRDNYGTLLNANRSYYLSRSQPPFLTQMLLGVYGKTHDRAWLRSALPAVEKYYRFWTSEPHLIPELGLSRYYDLGDGLETLRGHPLGGVREVLPTELVVRATTAQLLS